MIDSVCNRIIALIGPDWFVGFCVLGVAILFVLAAWLDHWRAARRFEREMEEMIAAAKRARELQVAHSLRFRNHSPAEYRVLLGISDPDEEGGSSFERGRR